MAPKPKSNAMQNSLSDQNQKSFKWQQLAGKYDEIKQVICSLGQEKFAPRAHRYDKEASFPFENYDDMREVGILAMTVPESFGGLGGIRRTGRTNRNWRILRGCS